jgi:Trypsin
MLNCRAISKTAAIPGNPRLEWPGRIRGSVIALLVECWSSNQSLGTTLQMTLPGTTLEPQIVGPGMSKSNPGTWPATFIFQTNKNSFCTSTAIGDHAVLTAAHCLNDGDEGILHIDVNNNINLKCQQHPNFRLDKNADYALCATTQTIPATFRPETINTDPSLTNPNRKLTLTGYGCTVQGGGDKKVGALFEGVATVSGGTAPFVVETTGGAATCFGDSGGGAYAQIGNSPFRRLVGVNSQTDLKQVSDLAVTATLYFSNWATEWSKANNSPICGLSPNATNCHQ